MKSYNDNLDYGFLTTDTRILNCLLDAKHNGNSLLQLFDIKYPDHTLNEDINAIHIACVSAEKHKTGFDHETFRDTVEIVITTRQLEYSKAVKAIKTVTNEIIRILKEDDYLNQRLTVQSISPIHTTDTYQLKKGHILLSFITAPVTFNNNDDDLLEVCELLKPNVIIGDGENIEKDFRGV